MEHINKTANRCVLFETNIVVRIVVAIVAVFFVGQVHHHQHRWWRRRQQHPEQQEMLLKYPFIVFCCYSAWLCTIVHSAKVNGGKKWTKANRPDDQVWVMCQFYARRPILLFYFLLSFTNEFFSFPLLIFKEKNNNNGKSTLQSANWLLGFQQMPQCA